GAFGGAPIDWKSGLVPPGDGWGARLLRLNLGRGRQRSPREQDPALEGIHEKRAWQLPFTARHPRPSRVFRVEELCETHRLTGFITDARPRSQVPTDIWWGPLGVKAFLQNRQMLVK